ncbi:hypothetical protein [Lentilactobacillus kefiri]|uniref:hypothetical protein n=1 Tax=Lentilactobacillus kefiri TaxID=33962 RepID=UPI0021C442BB|nr:hypothetical protein [Lentilactobacillus kefiri]MCP9369289.1 hypothetical protein [Lentilactobacillus kefiri]
MVGVKPIVSTLKCLWYWLTGGIALLLIYFYDGAISIPEISKTSDYHLVWRLSSLDWYFLVCLIMILPIARAQMKKLYQKDSTEFETYKDKALRLHHSDAQANHKGRSWSANGVTANPWEYQYSQTQSYKGAADFAYTVVKNLILNILIIIFGPIFLIYAIYKKLRHNKNL